MVSELASPKPSLPLGRDHRVIAVASVPTDYFRWLHRDFQSTVVDARYTRRVRAPASRSGSLAIEEGLCPRHTLVASTAYYLLVIALAGCLSAFIRFTTIEAHARR
jgi:hypothetical protein